MKIWFILEEEDYNIDDYSNKFILDHIAEKRECDIIIKDKQLYINMITRFNYALSSFADSGEDFWYVGQHNDIIEEIKKLAILEELNKEVLK